MFEERVILGNGFLLETFLFPDRSFRLSFRKGRLMHVEYKSDGKRHSRNLRGRENPYEFRSVEKLRYDFERDAEDALRQG